MENQRQSDAPLAAKAPNNSHRVFSGVPKSSLKTVPRQKTPKSYAALAVLSGSWRFWPEEFGDSCRSDQYTKARSRMESLA